MIHQITRKLSYSYEQFANFIIEENLKTEAFLSFVVFIFILFVLYS
jgi:hypothetical protein